MATTHPAARAATDTRPPRIHRVNGYAVIADLYVQSQRTINVKGSQIVRRYRYDRVETVGDRIWPARTRRFVLICCGGEFGIASGAITASCLGGGANVGHCYWVVGSGGALV